MLGGNGFVGRHAVAALDATSATVVLGTRTPAPNTNQKCFRLEEMTAAQDWSKIVLEFDVILNCVGILRPQKTASYEQIHHLVPQAIASACEGLPTRFVHVSALGLDSSDRSGFLTSKLNGEIAIERSHANWVIVRPSLLDGVGGYGAAWLRGVSRLPVFVVPADAKGRIAALTAADLGEALANLCLRSDQELRLDESRIFELGGIQAYTFEQHIRGLRLRHSTNRALALPIPGFVARIGAHICDLLRVTPFSFGHWELLRKDNIPIPNRLPELLGQMPDEVVPRKNESAAVQENSKDIDRAAGIEHRIRRALHMNVEHVEKIELLMQQMSVSHDEANCILAWAECTEPDRLNRSSLHSQLFANSKILKNVESQPKHILANELDELSKKSRRMKGEYFLRQLESTNQETRKAIELTMAQYDLVVDQGRYATVSESMTTAEFRELARKARKSQCAEIYLSNSDGQ